jgi:hypothetical protein
LPSISGKKSQHRATPPIAGGHWSNGLPAFLMVIMRGIQPRINDESVHQDHGLVRLNNSSPEQYPSQVPP